LNAGIAELAFLDALVEVVHAGGGLLRQAADPVEVLRVLVVDDVGEVTAVVEDHVERLAVREEQRLLDAPVVLLLRLMPFQA
jgi:hypothetical protein